MSVMGILHATDISDGEQTSQKSVASLLKLQIGPVQDFIAQARSTRDLWSGSYLLSWLMEKHRRPSLVTLKPA